MHLRAHRAPSQRYDVAANMTSVPSTMERCSSERDVWITHDAATPPCDGSSPVQMLLPRGLHPPTGAEGTSHGAKIIHLYIICFVLISASYTASYTPCALAPLCRLWLLECPSASRVGRGLCKGLSAESAFDPVLTGRLGKARPSYTYAYLPW
jgi:hypothetical protein